MNFIKSYFLCALVCSSLGLVAMEIDSEMRVEIQVERIIKKIKENDLVKNKDRYWLVKDCCDFVQAYFLTSDQITSKMEEFECDIQGDVDKEAVFGQLEKRHWYVHYLLNYLIDAKVREIQNITGSTVDIVSNLPMENGLKRLVHKRALEKCFDYAGINKPLAHVFLNKEIDIHCTDLCEHAHPIMQDLLGISEDNQYLLSVDIAGNEKIWDIQQAKTVDLEKSQRQAIEFNFGKWQKSTSLFGYYSPFHDAVDKDDQYYATEGKSSGEQFPILLWKRPTEKSYLCHQALLNSSNKPDELHTLLDSQSFAAIEGFPKTNLEKKINSILSKESAK